MYLHAELLACSRLLERWALGEFPCRVLTGGSYRNTHRSAYMKKQKQTNIKWTVHCFFFCWILELSDTVFLHNQLFSQEDSFKVQLFIFLFYYFCCRSGLFTCVSYVPTTCFFCHISTSQYPVMLYIRRKQTCDVVVVKGLRTERPSAEWSRKTMCVYASVCVCVCDVRPEKSSKSYEAADYEKLQREYSLMDITGYITAWPDKSSLVWKPFCCGDVSDYLLYAI